MVSAEHLREVELVSPGATAMTEGGRDFIHLPALRLPQGCTPGDVEALLCVSGHSGYSTRLFLAEAIPRKGANWTAHVVFGKTWQTWSWNHVPSSLRPMEILAEHLRGLR